MLFESIQEQHKNQLPFVVYRKPNALKVKALLQRDGVLHHLSDYSKSGFVFAPFDDAHKSILIPLENAKVSEMEYLNQVQILSTYKEISFSKEDKQQHIALVEKGIKAIEEKRFDKVVLSRQETVNISEFNIVETFEKLLVKYPSAFVYCWYHPKVGLWLGATPETLMKIEGNQFSMMSLAGTQEYQGTQDITWKDKEKEEQQIVTDFILDNITPSVENIKVSQVETVKAGNLLHLRTMISARLKLDQFKLQDIISSLHPTPAVCGLPKLKAKAFILEHEPYNREFYAGYLGELNFKTVVKPRSGKRNIENRAYSIIKKSTQLYVNLRCMQIKNEKAHVYVGGGVTKTSKAEHEWEETVSKSKVIKSILY